MTGRRRGPHLVEVDRELQPLDALVLSFARELAGLTWNGALLPSMTAARPVRAAEIRSWAGGYLPDKLDHIRASLRRLQDAGLGVLSGRPLTFEVHPGALAARAHRVELGRLPAEPEDAWLERKQNRSAFFVVLSLLLNPKKRRASVCKLVRWTGLGRVGVKRARRAFLEGFPEGWSAAHPNKAQPGQKSTPLRPPTGKNSAPLGPTFAPARTQESTPLGPTLSGVPAHPAQHARARGGGRAIPPGGEPPEPPRCFGSAVHLRAADQSQGVRSTATAVGRLRLVRGDGLPQPEELPPPADPDLHPAAAVPDLVELHRQARDATTGRRLELLGQVQRVVADLDREGRRVDAWRVVFAASGLRGAWGRDARILVGRGERASDALRGLRATHRRTPIQNLGAFVAECLVRSSAWFQDVHQLRGRNHQRRDQLRAMGIVDMITESDTRRERWLKRWYVQLVEGMLGRRKRVLAPTDAAALFLDLGDTWEQRRAATDATDRQAAELDREWERRIGGIA